MRNPVKLLLAQLIVIPLVILIFKMPAEKRVLSLAANTLFLTISLVTMFYRGPLKKWIQGLGTQFLLTAVLPITILRILSWESDFSSSVFLGICGNGWHSYSNLSFMFMLMGTLVVVMVSKMKSLHS